MAAFEEKVERGLASAQELLGEEYLPLLGEESLPAPPPSAALPSTEALLRKLKGVLKTLRAESHAPGSPSETLNRVYQLLICFALHARDISLTDHPFLGHIAHCEQLRDRLAAHAPAAPVPAPAAVPAAQPAAALRANPISAEMMRNRGIPKLRSLKKKQQTPRVKQRERLRKAELVMRSRGRRAPRLAPRVYDGEAGGIRVGVNRAIDI